MCGVVGYIGGNRNNVEFFEKGFKALAHRGNHGYGILQRTSKILRGITHTDKDTLLTAEQLEEETIFAIGHNRNSSPGFARTNKTCHPILKDDEGWFIIHNGYNREINTFFSECNYISDSEALLHQIFLHRGDKSLKSIVKDSGVIIITTGKEVIWHIDKERALFVNKEEGVFASEPIFKGTWWRVSNVLLDSVPINDFNINSFKVNETPIIVEETTLKKCGGGKNYHFGGYHYGASGGSCGKEQLIGTGETKCFKCLTD